MKRSRKTNFRRGDVWVLCADYLNFIREGGQITPSEWNQINLRKKGKITW